MKNKKIVIVSLSAGALCLLILFAFAFLFSNQYRKGLPEYPDLKNIPVSVKNQIISENRKAYWNPSEINIGTLGMVYHSCGFYEKASQCYRLAIRRSDNDWIWNYYCGYLNLELGESQASIENFDNVLKNNSTNVLALYYKAEAYQNLGSSADAKRLLKRIASLNEGKFISRDTMRENEFPIQSYAAFHLAHIYIDSNVLDSAEITLKNLIDKQITFGPAYRLLGVVYNRVGNLKEGDRYTVRANDLADYMPPSDLLIDKIAMISRSEEYLLKQIDDEIRSGNYKWSLIMCNHALKFMPENKYLISKTIFGNFIMGLNNNALTYLNRHLKYYSDDYNELMHLADLLFERGYDTRAMNYFNQAKKLKPQNSRLAIWLLQRGMEEDAISLLNEQLDKEPENIKILTDAADIMLRLGNIEKAKGYLDHIAKLSPSNTDAKKLEGTIAERQGNLYGAIAIYEAALKTDPKDLSNIKYLSALYLREKMWDKALQNFRLGLISYPNDSYILSGLGNLLLSCPDPKIRNTEEAKEYSERAFINYRSTYSTRVSSGKDLAAEYAAMGNRQQASFYINETIRIAGERNIPVDIGYFDELRKKYDF